MRGALCFSQHLFSKDFSNILKTQLRVSGGLAVQDPKDRGLLCRQQVGSRTAATARLSFSIPGSPSGSARAALRKLCPPECLLQYAAQGKRDLGEKDMHLFIYLHIYVYLKCMQDFKP